jgi:hypothetical protein
MSVQTSGSRLADAALRSVVWGFIGALFGALFVAAHALLAPLLPALDPLVVGAVAAGGIGAVVYSSMRLSLLAAGLCFLLLAVLQLGAALRGVPADTVWRLDVLLGLAAAGGAAAGAYYGHRYRQSHVYRALPKTLAGLVAGLLAGSAWWLLLQAVGEVPLGVSIAVLCPLVGWCYVALAGLAVRALAGRQSPRVDGALVGAVVSGLVALGFWATAGTLRPDVAGEAAAAIQAVTAQVPAAVVAGWLGGMVAGFTRGLLGFGWYDL